MAGDGDYTLLGGGMCAVQWTVEVVPRQFCSSG